MSRVASDETRAYGRSAGLLTAALGTAGLLLYAFFALASHTLEREDYGLVVLLWTAGYFTVSILFRPVEQLLSRTLAELDEQRRPNGHAIAIAARIQLAIAAVFILGAIVLRGTLEEHLFEGDSTVYWALIVAVVGYSGSYFARGYLAGLRHMPQYALLVLVESASRLVLALAVAVGIVQGMTPLALAIALAPFVSLLVIPLAMRKATGLSGARPPDRPGALPPSDFTLADGGSFAGAVLVIMLGEQVLINSGPLFAHAESGAAAAGFIFNVLMVARAPMVLFQAIAASLLPHLTRLRSRTGGVSQEAFSASVRATVVAIVAFAAAAIAFMATAGPDAMQLAFGDKFEYDRAGLVIVAAGMGVYLVAATLNQAVLAQGQVRRAAVCWVIAALGFVVLNLLPVLDVFRRIEVGFAAGAGVLCVLLALAYRRPHPHAGDELEPGSARELEVRLAAADSSA